MSWDVILVSSSITHLEDINTPKPATLGSKLKVISQLKSVFPDIAFSDPIWASVIRPNFSIEFNFGKDDPLIVLFLHIRGSDDVIESLRTVCQAYSWRAYDTTTGLFIDFENDPSRGLKKWQNYRDNIVSRTRNEGEEVVNQCNYAYVIKKKKSRWQFWK